VQPQRGPQSSGSIATPLPLVQDHSSFRIGAAFAQKITHAAIELIPVGKPVIKRFLPCLLAAIKNPGLNPGNHRQPEEEPLNSSVTLNPVASPAKPDPCYGLKPSLLVTTVAGLVHFLASHPILFSSSCTFNHFTHASPDKKSSVFCQAFSRYAGYST